MCVRLVVRISLGWLCATGGFAEEGGAALSDDATTGSSHPESVAPPDSADTLAKQLDDFKALYGKRGLGAAMKVWRRMDPQQALFHQSRFFLLTHLNKWNPEEETAETAACRIELVLSEPGAWIYYPNNWQHQSFAALMVYERPHSLSILQNLRASETEWSPAQRDLLLSMTVSALAHQGQWDQILSMEEEIRAMEIESDSPLRERDPLIALGAAKVHAGLPEQGIPLFFSARRNPRPLPVPAVLRKVALAEGFEEGLTAFLREAAADFENRKQSGATQSDPRSRFIQPTRIVLPNELERLGDPEITTIVWNAETALLEDASAWDRWLNRNTPKDARAREEFLPWIEKAQRAFPGEMPVWLKRRASTYFTTVEYQSDPELQKTILDRELQVAQADPASITGEYLRSLDEHTHQGAEGPLRVRQFLESLLSSEETASTLKPAAWGIYFKGLKQRADKTYVKHAMATHVLPGLARGEISPRDMKTVYSLLPSSDRAPFLDQYLEAMREPPEPEMALAMGEVFIRATPKAIELFRMAHESAPENPRVRELYARHLRDQGRTVEADGLVASTTPADPRKITLSELRVLVERGEVEEAVKRAHAKRNNTRGGDPRFTADMFRLLAKSGHWAEAEAFFDAGWSAGRVPGKTTGPTEYALLGHRMYGELGREPDQSRALRLALRNNRISGAEAETLGKLLAALPGDKAETLEEWREWLREEGVWNLRHKLLWKSISPANPDPESAP